MECLYYARPWPNVQKSHFLSGSPGFIFESFLSNANSILIFLFWSPEGNRPGLSQSLGQGTDRGWGDLGRLPWGSWHVNWDRRNEKPLATWDGRGEGSKQRKWPRRGSGPAKAAGGRVGQVNREEGSWRTLSGARPGRPRKATKSSLWKARGVNDWGRGHSGASGPIPHTWFMPSDHRPLLDIRSFPEEQLPTEASVTAKAPLGYQSQVTEMYLLSRTKEEGDLTAELLSFTCLFFLMLGKIMKEKSWVREWEPYKSVFNSSFVFISLLFQKLWILIRP